MNDDANLTIRDAPSTKPLVVNLPDPRDCTCGVTVTVAGRDQVCLVDGYRVEAGHELTAIVMPALIQNLDDGDQKMVRSKRWDIEIKPLGPSKA